MGAPQNPAVEVASIPGRPLDCGLLALSVVAGRYRIAADPIQLAHELGLGQKPSQGEDIVRAAKRLGLKARLIRSAPLERLGRVPLPVIIAFKDGKFGVLAHRRTDDTFRIGFPWNKSFRDMTLEQLGEIWSGETILVTRRFGGAGVNPTAFGFKWFLGSIWRYRKPLAHVLIASLFVQLFALVTPLFFKS